VKKWEYTMASRKVVHNGTNPSLIWEDKSWDKEKGQSLFDWLQEKGREGWELVSVTAVGPYSNTVLYTLKHPIEE